MEIIVIAVLTAVLGINAITAAPIYGTTCSEVSNTTSTGPCAYCLKPTNISQGDESLKNLYYVTDNVIGALQKIAKTVSTYSS